MRNVRLQWPPTLVPERSQYYSKEKPRKAPKYKILRKVMPHEEILSLIKRITYDLVPRIPHVIDNDVPWNESRIVEPISASLRCRELQPQHSEVREAAIKQGGVF